jgi:hypothetical protein
MVGMRTGLDFYRNAASVLSFQIVLVGWLCPLDSLDNSFLRPLWGYFLIRRNSKLKHEVMARKKCAGQESKHKYNQFALRVEFRRVTWGRKKKTGLPNQSRGSGTVWALGRKAG